MGPDLPNSRDGKVLEKPQKTCWLRLGFLQPADLQFAFAAATIAPPSLRATARCHSRRSLFDAFLCRR